MNFEFNFLKNNLLFLLVQTQTNKKKETTSKWLKKE